MGSNKYASQKGMTGFGQPRWEVGSYTTYIASCMSKLLRWRFLKNEVWRICLGSWPVDLVAEPQVARNGPSSVGYQQIRFAGGMLILRKIRWRFSFFRVWSDSVHAVTRHSRPRAESCRTRRWRSPKPSFPARPVGTRETPRRDTPPSVLLVTSRASILSESGNSSTPRRPRSVFYFFTLLIQKSKNCT